MRRGRTTTHFTSQHPQPRWGGKGGGLMKGEISKSKGALVVCNSDPDISDRVPREKKKGGVSRGTKKGLVGCRTKAGGGPKQIRPSVNQAAGKGGGGKRRPGGPSDPGHAEYLENANDQPRKR